MQAGKLRERLRLERPVVSVESDGGSHIDHLVVGTVWGQIRPLRATELLVAAQVSARETWVVVVRYRADIKPSWRVVTSDNRVLEFTGAINADERRRSLEIWATEKVVG